MNCKFCQQPCKLSSWDKIYPQEVTVWMCNNHSVPVKYYLDKVYDDMNGAVTYLWIDTVLFWSDNDQYFRAHFLPSTFYVDKHNVSTATIRKTVLSLMHHPDITPENVKEKIKLYLTFS